MTSHLQLRSCWQLIPPERELKFFKGVATGKGTILQWKVTHLRKYGQPKLNLMGEEKERTKAEWIEKRRVTIIKTCCRKFLKD